MRCILEPHEGKLIAISKWEMGRKSNNYRLLVDLDVIIADCPRLVSVYPNCISHLWVSSQLLGKQSFKTPYFQNSLILGKIARYQRLDQSFDYGISFLSASELKLAQLLFGYAPVLAIAQETTIDKTHLEKILSKTENLTNSLLMEFSELSLSNLSQISQLAIIKKMLRSTLCLNQ